MQVPCNFFPPPMIPQNPNHFAHLWQSPKNTKQKKKDIAKSLISGWSFSQRNIKTLQKRRMEKNATRCA